MSLKFTQFVGNATRVPVILTATNREANREILTQLAQAGQLNVSSFCDAAALPAALDEAKRFIADVLTPAGVQAAVESRPPKEGQTQHMVLVRIGSAPAGEASW